MAADVLAVLLPLILATRGLAGGCECAAVKSTAIVVNVARGWVIGRACFTSTPRGSPLPATMPMAALPGYAALAPFVRGR